MLRDDILDRIEYEELKVFSAADFIDLAPSGAVRKALERMEDDGTIRRLIQGFYDKPKFNNRFLAFEAPNIDDLAWGIANRYGWHICPSGNYALNILGLSTQIPSQYVYISDGPYRFYEVMGIRLTFKHSANREVSDFSPITSIVIQALKAIGQENLTWEDIEHLRRRLSSENKDVILQEGRRTSFWIYKAIRDICEV
ncbi:MAG: DUF6088 family protein [Muribaculaceae bacterium]|nr:DUF6088 family protein [Muribaculaceae bacterium]